MAEINKNNSGSGPFPGTPSKRAEKKQDTRSTPERMKSKETEMMEIDLDEEQGPKTPPRIHVPQPSRSSTCDWPCDTWESPYIGRSCSVTISLWLPAVLYHILHCRNDGQHYLTIVFVKLLRPKSWNFFISQVKRIQQTLSANIGHTIKSGMSYNPFCFGRETLFSVEHRGNFTVERGAFILSDTWFRHFNYLTSIISARFSLSLACYSVEMD